MVANVEQGTGAAISLGFGTPATPIAYIMSRFPKLTETFILREMLELEQQGQPILIFPLLREQPEVCHANVNRLKAKVYYAPFLSPAILLANLHYLGRSPARYLKVLWSALSGSWGSVNLFVGAIGIFPKAVYFARLMEQKGVCHIHAHYATHPTLAALIISELNGISFSFTAHAHDIFVHTKMLDVKMKKARYVVAISEFNKKYLLRLCPGIPEQKIQVIHCGIDLDRYKTDRGRQGKDRFTILCVASLQPYKGIEYLVQACALLKRRLGDFRCLVVGEGMGREGLERLIAELELREIIHLLGNQSEDKVASLLAEVDLFVLPSVVAADGQMEGIPLALMEAMASSLPVVATRLSGIPELVQEGVTGLLVPPRDEKALAEAIASLSQGGHLCQELGRRAKEKVASEFTLSSNVEKLNSLFSLIVDQESEMRKQKQGMTERIRERASQYFSELEGDAVHFDIHFCQQTNGADSEVHEVILGNGRPGKLRLILKQHRSNWTQVGEGLDCARHHAQREYQALTFLWQEFSRRSDRFTVPRPLEHFPESAALLMEKCPGRRLDWSLRWARLRKTGFEIRELCQTFRRCGEWLGLFHRITARDGNLSEIYQRIEGDIHHELAVCSKRGLDADVVRALGRTFEDKKHRVFNGDHNIVGYHCDFGPHNVFLSPERITVIDFEGLQEGIIYEDICYFLGVIEIIPLYHLSEELSHRIRRSFLEGYAQYGYVAQEELDFFIMVKMVKLMAHNPRLGEQADWWDRWKQKWMLERYTSWFKHHVGQVPMREG